MGDKAASQHLYEDAAQHYQDASNVEGITPSDSSRISEKLASALSRGRDPHAASVVFDQALAIYLNRPAQPADASKTVEILLQRARQLWIEAKTESALPLLDRAIGIAKMSGDLSLFRLANTRMVSFLNGLNRYEEAESLLDAMEPVQSSDSGALRGAFYTGRGVIAATHGNAAEAFKYFEIAIIAAKEDTDVFNLANIWSVYGYWAVPLGKIELAKACYEQALLVARRYHVIWQIPHVCLDYARVLALRGHWESAYECVLNARAYDAYAPNTVTSFAEIGIPLALHMKDEALLEKCTHHAAIEFAFQSGVPSWICLTSAAFAQWYAVTGREEEAQSLLHRAIKAVRSSAKPGDAWTFSIAVARFGLLTDMRDARRFVSERTALPCSSVSKACLTLFDAIVAQRRGQHSKMQKYGASAVRRFEALGWYGYADLARTLQTSAEPASSVVTRRDESFSDALLTLTSRQRQVAQLVLKGFTNREIAMMLSITERTVETHMTTIMGILGVRSRYQITNTP